MNAIIDITKYKRDVFILAGLITSKNLISQWISIITRELFNILDYIQVSWKLSLFFWINRLSLDQTNLNYRVYLIQKSGFQDLAFLVLKDDSISESLKIIEDVIALEKYLEPRLLKYICNRNWALMIIQLISSNLDAKTRTKVIEDLGYRGAQICICTKYIKIGITIPNIMHIV